MPDTCIHGRRVSQSCPGCGNAPAAERERPVDAHSDIKPENPTAGAYIREQRESADLSQREVAALLGVSHVFVGAMERGVKRVPPAMVEALAEHVPGLDVARLRQLMAIAAPSAGEIAAWLGGIDGLEWAPEPNGTRQRIETLVAIAFRAGWRRGACAGARREYPDDLLEVTRG